MIFDSFLLATEVHILNIDLSLARQELLSPEFVHTSDHFAAAFQKHRYLCYGSCRRVPDSWPHMVPM